MNKKKTLLIIIIIILVMIASYSIFKYSNSLEQKVESNTYASINEYAIYGIHFRIKGSITLDEEVDDLKLVLKNNNEDALDEKTLAGIRTQTMQTVQNTFTNDYKKKLETLNNEKNTLEKRLSNLIDMKLDDYSNKEAYTSKEKEINERLDLIKEEIANYETLENENKNLSKQIKIVEELFEEPTLLKEFDDLAFSTMVKKIIVGGYDENGSKNSKIIRFVLNTGEEKPFILADKKGNKELVSFELGDRIICSRCGNANIDI